MSKSESESKSIERRRRMGSVLVEADLEGDVGPVIILAPILRVKDSAKVGDTDVPG